MKFLKKQIAKESPKIYKHLGEFMIFQNLIDEGYIKITIKSSPNEKHTKWVGLILKK